MRIVVAGEKSLLVACSEILAGRGHEIVAVGSSEKSIVEWAGESGLPCFGDSQRLDEHLEKISFDVFFSIGNLRLVPVQTIDRARREAINYHDSPLPRYAGLNAPAWAIINRETRHGITWHRMTAGIDEGDIVGQRMIPIEADETAYSLNLGCYEAAIESFEVLIEQIERGTVEPKAQALKDRTYFARDQRPPAHAVIDWNQPVASIDALARGLDFGPHENPLCRPKILAHDQVFILTGIEPTGTPARGAPGSVSEIQDGEVIVSATDREMAITAVRSYSGRSMALDEWIQSMRISPGVSLGHLSPDEAGRLSMLHAQISRHEAFWIRELNSFLTLPLPPKSHWQDDKTVRCWEPTALSREIRLKLEEQSESDRFCLLGACLLLAKGRLDRQDETGIVMEPLSARQLISGFEQYFTDRLPVIYRIAHHSEPLEDIRLAKAKLADVLAGRRTFSWDLLARHREFSSSSLCDQGPIADLAISAREISGHETLPVRLTLVDGRDGIGWSFLERDRDDAMRTDLQHALAGLINDYFGG